MRDAAVNAWSASTQRGGDTMAASRGCRDYTAIDSCRARRRVVCYLTAAYCHCAPTLAKHALVDCAIQRCCDVEGSIDKVPYYIL